MARSPRKPPTIKSRRPTMADVAAEAGCSPTLVSSVINRSSTSANPSEAMARKIREAAARLGYHADFASQSLARRTTRTIGIYVPTQPGIHIGYAYESAILDGVVSACHERDYDVLVINLGGKSKPENCLHKFAQRRIDGLVLVHVGDGAKWVAPLMKHHLHAVSVNYHGPVKALSRVNFDDHAAGVLATEHLVKLGHRRIAYFAPFLYNPGRDHTMRRKGFEQAMQAHGLQVHAPWIVDPVNPQLPDDYAVMKYQRCATSAIDYLMALPGPRPTAAVCYNDLFAMMIMQRLRSYGMRIPADISMIGIDDMDMSAFADPPLTTIRQPLSDMGEQATRLLLDAVTDPARGAVRQPAELVAPRLVVRASTCAPAPDAAA